VISGMEEMNKDPGRIFEVEVIHSCPNRGESIMPCCGKEPSLLPDRDEITLNESNVTCGKLPNV